MLSLPRGIAVYENVQAAQYEGPAILRLLKETKLNGYARFQFFETTANLLFVDGNLIHLVVETKDAWLTGLEGLASLFELIVSEGGRLDVYRVSAAVARLVLGFMRGSRLHEAQELRLLDKKALLESIRLQKLTGALHIYTPDRCSMIFYQEGVPLGFFHDGTEEIGTSAAEFQNIASMPGAMVDVTKMAQIEESSLTDVLEMINVEKVWQAGVGKYAAKKDAIDKDSADKLRAAREAKVAALEQAVTEIGGTFLGKIGKTLVEKEIAARGGKYALLEPAGAEGFLAGVEKGAKLLTSGSKTKEMLEALKAELSGRAKGFSR
jgi:hypothetical protein